MMLIKSMEGLGRSEIVSIEAHLDIFFKKPVHSDGCCALAVDEKQLRDCSAGSVGSEDARA